VRTAIAWFVVLDGEVATNDEQLRSRFDWLREPDVGAVATPPMFMAFESSRGSRCRRPRRLPLEGAAAPQPYS
jgi:hypothetical protein